MAKVVAPGQNETESDSLRQLGTDSDKMGWDSLGQPGRDWDNQGHSDILKGMGPLRGALLC
jgi:hypothetical protein